MHPLKVLKGIHRTSKHPNSGYMRDNPKYSMYSVGNYSFGEPLVLNWGEKATLKIGNFCSIADGVIILLGGEHKTCWLTTYPFWVQRDFEELKNVPYLSGTKGDVKIGNDVWIGMDALILSGVSVGDGAVIGARSVVTKNVDPYTVVAGNPARIIRKRFDRETINKLEKIKWWSWDVKRIKENMTLLLSERVDEFMEKNSQ